MAKQSTVIAGVAMKKSSGIGAVYSSSTGSIVSAFNTVNTLASAAHMLAQNAESQAMISRVESSNALLEVMGVNTTDMPADVRIANASALMQALRNM